MPGRAAFPQPATTQTATPKPTAPVSKLSEAQLIAAKAWYKTKAEQYTPAVLKEIQKKLGVPITGKVDTGTLQAIAKWQGTNKPLPINGKDGKFKIDGKADPVLLNHLFPTGLAKPEVLSQYTKDFTELVDSWPKLTIKERQGKIATILNASLKASQVPSVTVSLTNFEDKSAGKFYYNLWQIQLNSTYLQNDKLTVEQAIDLADTLYHEARHTEQFYQMARLQAGKNVDPTGTMGISSSVGTQSKKAPLLSASIQGIQAGAYYQSTYGDGHEARNDIQSTNSVRAIAVFTAKRSYESYYVKLEKLRTEIEKSKDQLHINSKMSEWNKLKTLYDTAVIDLDKATSNYQNSFNATLRLPEEADAWRIGGTAGESYKKGIKK